MKNNSLLIPLKINSNKENYNQNLYTQYTTNISSKRNNLHFSDPKKDYSSKTSKNKMLDLNSKVNDKNMKYEEYYTLNRNNNSKNNNVIARLNNDNKKQRIIKSNGTYKMNNKIINGKQNLENNNIQNHQNLRNNHSFYESKYNKKNGNSITINNILTNNSNKENLNLSNIIQPKNLTKKHIILNVDKISNNKNELTYQNTCKKPLTPIISISQEKRKAIMNSSYQTIQINNKNNKRVLKTTQNSVINRQINLKNNSIINDSKKRINQSKSSDIIGIIKTDSNIRNKNDNKYKIIELNKPLNSILKNSSVSPNNNIKNSIINTKNYPINHIFNKETLVINPNNRNERESNITNINISQKNTYINSSTNKSNKILINNNLLYLSNNERKAESNTFKLNKKYFEYSPRFTEYMTINREKSYNTLLSLGKNNKSNENNSIPFKSNIFNVKENDQKKSENITIYSSANNTKVLSKNINDKNKIIKFIPKTVKNNNNNKINLREKTYLISPRNYDLSKKTIDTENSLQRNKNKSDLTILPQKAFVNPYIQNRINYIKSCKSISISGTTEEGFKKRNQDSFVIERNINGIYNFNIFGVLDGHGDDGHYVSQFVSRFIINSIKNNSIIKKCTTPKEIYEKIILNKYKLIENIFLDADMQIRKEKFDYKGSGTTCIIIIQLEEKIICANTGDSRAIIVYNKSSNKNNNKKNILENSKVFPLSYDCKPDLPNERKRIYEHGGVVEKALDEYDEEEEGPFRVYIKGEDYPGLAMSRSIGDIDAKKIGVIPNPQFIEYTINDETKYMIICSDGIWEFISNEEAMKIGNEYYLNNDPSGFCQCLYETSLDYWNEEGYSVDDITAIVVFF